MKAIRPPFYALLIIAALGCGEDTADDDANNNTNNVDPTPTGDVLYRFVCERTADRAFGDETPDYVFAMCEGEEPPEEAPGEFFKLYAQQSNLINVAEQIVPQAGRDQADDTLQLLAPERNEELFMDMSAGLKLSAEQPTAAAAVTRLQFDSKYRGSERTSLLVDFLRWEGSSEFAQMGARTKIWESPEFESFLQVRAAAGAVDAEADDPTQSFWLRPDLDTRDGRQVLIRDSRGLPALAADAEIEAPFADVDDDGLPDVDFAGRFVNADGDVIEDQIGFDNFASLELRQTNLDQGIELLVNSLPEGQTQHLPNTFAALFGPATTGTAVYGQGQLEYASFDTAQSPLVDLYHAVITIAAIPDIALFLRIIEEQLLAEEAGQFAGPVMLDALGTGQVVRPLVAEDVSLAFNDLGLKLSEAQFWENSAPLIEDEASRAAVSNIAAMMTDARDVTFDPNNPDGPPVFSAEKVVNWDEPAAPGNRSVFLRSLDLMAAMEGVEVCNPDGTVLRYTLQGVQQQYPLFGTAGRCEIFRIENLAQAYRDAIAGNLAFPWGDGIRQTLADAAGALGVDVETAFEEAVGIQGLGRTPTPQALTRLVFHSVSTGDGTATCDRTMLETCGNPQAAQIVEIAVDSDGTPLIEGHGAIALAWDPAYDSFQAWMQLLRATPVQAQLFTTLQAHWEPSDARQVGRLFMHAEEIVDAVVADDTMDVAVVMRAVDAWFSEVAAPREGQTVELAGQSAPSTPANLMAYTHARRDKQWADAELTEEATIFNAFSVNLAEQFGSDSAQPNRMLGNLMKWARENATDREVPALAAWIESPIVSTTMRLFAATYLRIIEPTAELAQFLRENRQKMSFEIANYMLTKNSDLAVTTNHTWAPLYAPNAKGFVEGAGELPVESSAVLSAVRLWMVIASQDATVTPAVTRLLGHSDDDQQSAFEFLVGLALDIAPDGGPEQNAVFVLSDFAAFLTAAEFGLSDVFNRLIEDWRP